MAVLNGTILDIFGHTVPMGPVRDGASPTNEVMCCYMTVTWTGTYAQADNVAVLAIPTAIASSKRNGKTIALLDCSFAQPGDEAGVAIGAKTVVPSGTGITCELTGADMSTEHANAALGVLGRPLCFHVTYQQT